MKKLFLSQLCVLGALPLLATTYYWAANAPESRIWADATDLENWSTEWGSDNYPVPTAHPSALPASGDALWLCRDIMLDLKGQSWTMAPYMDGKRYRLGDGKEYYGGANYTFGITNGTFNLTKVATFRGAGGVVVEHGATVNLYRPILDTAVPITVRNGGSLSFEYLQCNNGSVTVESGGSLTMGRLSVWSYAGASATTIVNEGNMAGSSSSSFVLYKYGTSTINSSNRVTVRQRAGTMTLSGPFKRDGTATSYPDLYAMTLEFSLEGGTLRSSGTVEFDCTSATVADNAEATLDVDAGKTLDMTSFSYGANAAISKTGEGTATFGGGYPSSLAIAGGVAVLRASSSPVTFATMSFGAGTTSKLGLGGMTALSLSVDPAATVEVDTASLNVGDTILTCTDSSALAMLAARINASLGDEAGLRAVVEDDSVLLAQTGVDRNTITVPSGEMAWSDWVAEHGEPSAALALVKEGPGTLVVDADLTGFTAGIHVKEGIWRGSSPSHFCANGATIVVTNDGATIEMAATADNSSWMGTRTFRLKGTGVGGRGAVCDISAYKQQDWHGMISGNVVLEGDTLISATGSVRKDLGGNSTINMNGYTLTIKRENALNQVAIGSTIVNPGNIIMDTCTFFCPAGTGTGVMNGGAANTITIRNRGCAEFWGMTGANCQWRLNLDDGGYVKLKALSNVWKGPVSFNGSGNSHLQGMSGAAWTVEGPVTGSGKLDFNEHVFTVNFPNVGNDFTGTVTGMAGDTLNYAGRVGDVGKMLSGTMSHMGLLGLSPFSLGSLTFSGASSLTGGVGTVVSVTKTGAGELKWNSYVGGGELDIQGGGVALGRQAGLYQGRIMFDANSSGTWDAAMSERPLAVTNELVTTLKYAKEVAQWKDYMIATYDGYVWNRTGSEVTWNVHMCFDDASSLWIDGVKTISQRGWTTVVKKDITFAPGAHRLTFNAYNATGGKGPSTASGRWTAADGTACSTKGFAIKTSPGEGSSADDYIVPEDDGTGSLFTPAKRLPFSSITFASGTYLDLGGDPVSVSDVSGCGDFRNGDVTVDGIWTIAAVPTGYPAMTVDGKLTFAEGSSVEMDKATARTISSRGVALATATGGIAGVPACTAKGVELSISADGTRLMAFGCGTGIIIR